MDWDRARLSMLLCTYTYCIVVHQTTVPSDETVLSDETMAPAHETIRLRQMRLQLQQIAVDSDGSCSSVGSHCVYSHGGCCCCTVYRHLVQEVNKHLTLVIILRLPPVGRIWRTHLHREASCRRGAAPRACWGRPAGRGEGTSPSDSVLQATGSWAGAWERG